MGPCDGGKLDEFQHVVQLFALSCRLIHAHHLYLAPVRSSAASAGENVTSQIPYDHAEKQSAEAAAQGSGSEARLHGSTCCLRQSLL